MNGIKFINKNNKGITLIALVVTIVVLLILAGITIQLVFADGGIIGQAQKANEQYKIEQARERISLTLSNAQMDKAVNVAYNENEYLDSFILKYTSNTNVQDEIVIVDGYAFELDRSVPKLGEYIGKESELVFPEVTVDNVLADDLKTATITINAKEEVNGINKIEIWQDGVVIKTYTYDNVKDPITEDYVVRQNGTYVIKVYAKLKTTKETRIDRIYIAIEYTPNGNTEYKREHQVKVTVNKEEETVKSMKYQWLNTIEEPSSSTFTATCQEGETLTKNGITGTYYLWVMLETTSGVIRIERSNAFCFDNEGPIINSLSTTPVSETSFTINVTASDEHSKIAKYEFYVNDELQEEQETTSGEASFTVTGVDTGETECYVVVTDNKGNTSQQSITGQTKLYTWEKWSTQSIRVYEQKEVSRDTYVSSVSDTSSPWYYSVKLNNTTGMFDYRASSTVGSWNEARSGWIIVCSLHPECFSNSRATYWCGRQINNWRVSWNRITYGSQANITYSKGTTQYPDVTSASSTAYPNNEESGSYWYIYKGIY